MYYKLYIGGYEIKYVTVVYKNKVGDGNPKVHKRTCIIGKVDVMKHKMDNTWVIIFVHKKKVDSKKTGHR